MLELWINPDYINPDLLDSETKSKYSCTSLLATAGCVDGAAAAPSIAVGTVGTSACGVAAMYIKLCTDPRSGLKEWLP